MFNTQASSKPRLKNDTLGSDSLTRLYDAYVSMGDDMFEDLMIGRILGFLETLRLYF